MPTSVLSPWKSSPRTLCSLTAKSASFSFRDDGPVGALELDRRRPAAVLSSIS